MLIGRDRYLSAQSVSRRDGIFMQKKEDTHDLNAILLF